MRTAENMSRGDSEHYRMLAEKANMSRILNGIERRAIEKIMVRRWLEVGVPKLQARGITVTPRHWPARIRKYAKEYAGIFSSEAKQ